MLIAILFILSHPIDIDSLLLNGLHYMYEERYSEAEKEFFSAINVDPQNPAGYFFISALYGLYMVDFANDSLEPQFYAYLDTTIFLSKRLIYSTNSTSGLPWLWLGGSYSLSATYKFVNRGLLSGIPDGSKSINNFSIALERDSSLFDAYIGISSYDYLKYRFLSFMPWLRNNNWEAEIKLACDSSRYFRVVALATYSLLLNEEGRYLDACDIIDSLVNEFPHSRTFRWIRVKIYIGMKEWDLAIDEYKKLLELTLEGQSGNFYNMGYCRLGLAKAYFEVGNFIACQAQCKEIIELPGSPRLKKIQEKARKLLIKVKKNLTSL